MRKFSDGRIEIEFNLETGDITPWGKETPDDLVEVAWVPMTHDLAAKIAKFGVIGIPTRSPVVAVKAKPGENVIAYFEPTIYTGVEATCVKCQKKFLSFGPPTKCPHCQAEETPEETMFDIVPKQWQQVTYSIGIEGKFKKSFTPTAVVTESL